MRVLGLIPARGGSKGIPRKNLHPVNGQPLLALTIGPALAAARLDRVILSTDDEEIAAAGRALGADVPYLRPASLATDTAPTLPVIQHALSFCDESGDRFDAVCLLQPTSPMRTAADIDACIGLLESTGADSVFSMLPVPHHYNPHWVFEETGDGLLRLSTGEKQIIPRRQELPPAYHRDGSIYVTRRQTLLEGNSLYGSRIRGYLMNYGDTPVNIDTPQDITGLEKALARGTS